MSGTSPRQHRPPQAPQVSDPKADQRFRDLARAQGMDPDALWVGGYVNESWQSLRPLLQAYTGEFDTTTPTTVLEFGCNLGANSIVLASLGAEVCGVDVSQIYVELAKANVARYGLSDRIQLQYCEDTRELPWPDRQFDHITCNSVLEYVPAAIRREVILELARVLRPGGQLIITGTSNRLWPRDVHGGRWLVNYLPARWDSRLFKGQIIERGISPFEITRTLPEYINIDLQDRGQRYRKGKREAGLAPAKLTLLKATEPLARIFGCSTGMLTSSFTLVLKKPEVPTSIQPDTAS